MKDQRPVNLDLKTFKFPITSISSILHRVSGFIIFVLIPIALFALGRSVESIQGYASITAWGDNWLFRFIIASLVAAMFYHVVAGVRHLVMDWGYWETLETGQTSARVTLVLGIGGAAILFLMTLFG